MKAKSKTKGGGSLPPDPGKSVAVVEEVEKPDFEAITSHLRRYLETLSGLDIDLKAQGRSDLFHQIFIKIDYLFTRF